MRASPSGGGFRARHRPRAGRLKLKELAHVVAYLGLGCRLPPSPARPLRRGYPALAAAMSGAVAADLMGLLRDPRLRRTSRWF